MARVRPRRTGQTRVVSSSGTAILVRHGESTANAAGLFTGVLDVPLSPQGVEEAHDAADLIRASGVTVTAAYCSELQRSWRTAEVIAADMPTLPPFRRDWRLNERNYGALTGRTKSGVLAEFGEAQFLAWRRSVRTAPPPMADSLYDELAASPLFQRLPAAALTRTESLADVMVRVGHFWHEAVEPELRRGGGVIVVGHGNSLRALCGVVDRLPDAEIRVLALPTGHPLRYDFDLSAQPLTGPLAPMVRGGRYLDEPAALLAAQQLAREGGT